MNHSPADPSRPVVAPGRPIVAIAHAGQVGESPAAYTDASLNVIRRLTAEVVSLATDLPAMVRGKTVLVKPNLVRPNPKNPFAVVTDERVLFALVELLKDAGAREIWIGDNPGYGLPLAEALAQLGDFKARLAGYGARLRFFDEEEKVVVDNPEATIFSPMILPKSLLDAEVYINLPKMKTHMHALVTLGIKNQYGLILDDQRMFFHRNDLHVKMVDILYKVRPHLTLVDGIIAAQGQAPLSGSVVPDMNTLVAGEDIVAVDTVATSVMGIHPMEVAMLRLCRQEGLGETDVDRIEIRGQRIDAVRRQFTRPIISPQGAYDEVQCIEGGACNGCLSALRHSLDKLAGEGALAGNPIQSVYVGKPMPDMVNLKKLRGPLWCFGSCAADLIFSQAERKPLARFIPGCPPHILEFYKAYKQLMAEDAQS